LFLAYNFSYMGLAVALATLANPWLCPWSINTFGTIHRWLFNIHKCCCGCECWL